MREAHRPCLLRFLQRGKKREKALRENSGARERRQNLDTSIGWLLLLQVVLIALNAVFACAEIAVLSVNEVKLSKMVSEGSRKAKRLSRLTAQPARFLATIQVAITLAGFLGSAFAAENFSDPLVDWLVGITLILSFFTLVFGELVPKRIAMKQSEKVALNISGLITVISKLFAPIVWLLSASTNGILRLLGIDPNEAEEQVGEEDIRMMVDASSEHGGIDHEEKEFIQNVFEFDDLPTARTWICCGWTTPWMIGPRRSTTRGTPATPCARTVRTMWWAF